MTQWDNSFSDTMPSFSDSRPSNRSLSHSLSTLGCMRPWNLHTWLNSALRTPFAMVLMAIPFPHATRARSAASASLATRYVGHGLAQDATPVREVGGSQEGGGRGPSDHELETGESSRSWRGLAHRLTT